MHDGAGFCPLIRVADIAMGRYEQDFIDVHSSYHLRNLG